MNRDPHEQYERELANLWHQYAGCDTETAALKANRELDARHEAGTCHVCNPPTRPEPDTSAYPFHIRDCDGETIDHADNVETVTAILYGDLSTHDGTYRAVDCPDADSAERLRYEARINADCYGIPIDVIHDLSEPPPPPPHVESPNWPI